MFKYSDNMQEETENDVIQPFILTKEKEAKHEPVKLTSTKPGLVWGVESKV